jgi:hypothetical protein
VLTQRLLAIDGSGAPGLGGLTEKLVPDNAQIDAGSRPVRWYLRVPSGVVEAAVAYYGEYRDEVDEEIELNEQEYERGRAAAMAGERAVGA